MSSVRRIKTVKFSSMLDKLISIAEYSIFLDDSGKFANIVIYNSSDRLVKNFEMKLEIYDENKARIKNKTISINNLSLRPKLYLKLNSKISLPIEADGFNYLTISVNSGIDSSSIARRNVTKGNYKPLKTRDSQIFIKNMDVSASKVENVSRKTHLKTKWLFLLPVICLASVGLTSIYYDTKVGDYASSATRISPTGKIVVAEKTDFRYSVSSTSITLSQFSSNKTRLYFDPSVFVSNYSGQTIVLGNDLFRNSNIESLVIYGPCELNPACFAYADKLEHFSCTNYTISNSNYVGRIGKISSNCFFGCSKLKTFMYQEITANSIPAGAFYGCSDLTNFVLPSVSTIDKNAFTGCMSLGKNITIPSSVSKIGEKAYADSSINEVTFANPYTIKEENSFNSNTRFYGSTIYDEEGKEV